MTPGGRCSSTLSMLTGWPPPRFSQEEYPVTTRGSGPKPHSYSAQALAGEKKNPHGRRSSRKPLRRPRPRKLPRRPPAYPSGRGGTGQPPPPSPTPAPQFRVCRLNLFHLSARHLRALRGCMPPLGAWPPPPAPPSPPALPAAALPGRTEGNTSPPRVGQGREDPAGKERLGSRRPSRFRRNGWVRQCPRLVPKEKPRHGRLRCASPRSHVDVAGKRGARGLAEILT